MTQKVRGRVHVIEPTKEYGQKGFRKRLVVLSQKDGKYTNYVPVEFTRDACDDADGMREGDDVEIHYVLKGREWRKDDRSAPRYFLSAEAVGFTHLSGGGQSRTAAPF